MHKKYFLIKLTKERVTVWNYDESQNIKKATNDWKKEHDDCVRYSLKEF